MTDEIRRLDAPHTLRTSRRRVLGAGAALALAGVAGPKSLSAAPRGARYELLSPAQGEDRGTLIIRTGSFPATFNPLLNDVRVWLYDGLVMFDENMNPIPDLAERWEISEDGLVYTFYLRQNVTFHDGHPMTADDVVFTANLTLDENVGSAYRSKFVVNGQPVVWAKVDDYTVTATLPQPFSAFLAKCSRADEIFFCILPKHLLENEPDLNSAAFNLNPVGTGPYKFAEYSADERLVMQAHDAYHHGRPGCARVVRLAFPNEQSALAALKSGEIDIAGLREAGNVQAAEEDANIEVHRYDSNWIFAARFNMANPILQDSNVRKAIAHAIDRENLVKAVVSPTASVGNSPISIGWAASPNVSVFAFDMEGAKTLLEESGWVGSGTREKDGQALKVSMSIYPDYAAPDLAAGMQALLSQIGVELTINQMEYAAFETAIYQDKNFDIYMDWQGFGVDPDIASRWTTAPADATSYLDNPSGYSNPDVDAALAAAAVALTQEERQTQLWAAQDQITADCPCVWLYLWEAQIAAGANVAGLSLPGSTADMDNTGVFRENWMVTSSRQ